MYADERKGGCLLHKEELVSVPCDEWMAAQSVQPWSQSKPIATSWYKVEAVESYRAICPAWHLGQRPSISMQGCRDALILSPASTQLQTCNSDNKEKTRTFGGRSEASRAPLGAQGPVEELIRATAEAKHLLVAEASAPGRWRSFHTGPRPLTPAARNLYGLLHKTATSVDWCRP